MKLYLNTFMNISKCISLAVWLLAGCNSAADELDPLEIFEKQMEIRQQAKLKSYPGGTDEGVLEVQDEISPFVQKEAAVLEDFHQQEASEF